MTTPKLSSEKLLDFSLFKNVTRRRLSHILVAFLVNFFTVSVPFMLCFGNYAERYGNYAASKLIERALRDVNDIMVLNLVFVYMLAAYFGIITLGYMMKRKSAHFYHALPQKRETLYLTSIASSLFCVSAGALLSLAISSVELAIFGVGYGEVFASFLSLAFNNVLVFLSTYAIVVFAGTVSGNGIVQLLMSIVIMLYPFATYFGMLCMRQCYEYYFWIDYFANEKIFQWLTPFAHVMYNYSDKISILTTALAVVASVLLIVGGYFIYKKRAIENSENTVVFKRIGSVLKYMFMFPITMFAGMFFFTIEENTFSLIFGFVSGALLSFMLFNTILEKTPKAMFKNFKGLCIFLAAFMVFALVYCFDVFNIDEYIPGENNISSVELRVDSVTFENNRFDDPEMISALVTLLKNQREANRKNVSAPTSDYRYTFGIDAAMHTKLGIPIARSYRISKFTEGAEEFLRLYANDGRLQAAYDMKISQIGKYLGNNYYAEMTFSTGVYKRAECSIDELMSVYLSEAPAMNYDALSKPAAGYITVRYIKDRASGEIVYDIYRDNDDGDIFNELPVYSNMTKTIAYLDLLTPLNDYNSVENDQLLKFPEDCRVAEAYVYDTREGVSVASANLEARFISRLDVYPRKRIDPQTAKKLYELLNLFNSGEFSSVSRLFTAIDTDYVVSIDYIDDYVEGNEYELYEKYYVDDYYGYEDVKVTAQTNHYQKELVFPKGTTPDYVKALFE